MHEAEKLRADLQRLPPTDRLSRLIIHLADQVGQQRSEGIVIELGMPREELAGMAAMSRSSAVAILSRMQEQGVLGLGRNRVTVKDVAALETMAARRGNPGSRRPT